MKCVSPVSPVSAAVVSQTHYQDYKAETELRQRGKDEMLGQLTPDPHNSSNDNGDKPGCDRLQAGDQRVR